VTRFYNLVRAAAQPPQPQWWDTLEGIISMRNGKIKQIEVEQAAVRDKAIAHGINPKKAWATYYQRHGKK